MATAIQDCTCRGLHVAAISHARTSVNTHHRSEQVTRPLKSAGLTLPLSELGFNFIQFRTVRLLQPCIWKATFWFGNKVRADVASARQATPHPLHDMKRAQLGWCSIPKRFLCEYCEEKFRLVSPNAPRDGDIFVLSCSKSISQNKRNRHSTITLQPRGPGAHPTETQDSIWFRTSSGLFCQRLSCRGLSQNILSTRKWPSG